MPEASSETKHRPGEAPRDRLRIVSGSKRDGQHAEYHQSETKRRKSGAQRAASIQQKATDLVQQVASLGEPSLPEGSHGVRADIPLGLYSTFSDSKPIASSDEQARRSTNPTEGLPMQTGHYTTSPSDSDPDAIADPAAAAQAPGTELPETSSAGQVDLSSETDAESPAIEAYKQLSKAKQVRQALEESSDSKASKERQQVEQTNQIHQQNDPEEEKR